jgi:SAM-dependent methyltransferase
MKFQDIKNSKTLYLYAGDLKKWNCISPAKRFALTNKKWIGLTLPKYGKESGTQDDNHILFDILTKMPLDDNTVDIYQSEDVHEHIEYDLLTEQINDIYRCLKKGGLFRLSVPDYNCDILYNRTEKDKYGKLLFDKSGGGYYDEKEKKVMGNGHVWFPNYENVKTLLESTHFSNDKINYLHYYDENKNPITNNIDYSLGYVKRTPDNDERVKTPYRPMSIVVDCYK